LSRALVIVDFQNDFTPGGALPVADGDRIAAPLAPLLDRFDLVVATRDWHPPDHGSFRYGCSLPLNSVSSSEGTPISTRSAPCCL
jgi:nicotinamidase/pyrazinamidase